MNKLEKLGDFKLENEKLSTIIGGNGDLIPPDTAGGTYIKNDWPQAGYWTEYSYTADYTVPGSDQKTYVGEQPGRVGKSTDINP